MGDEILCCFNCFNNSQNFVLQRGKRWKKLDFILKLRLDYRLHWTGWLTGRSEAVLSKYLILWFNALFKQTERAQISIKNVSRCRQVSHHYRTGDCTNKTSTGTIFCTHAEGFVPKFNIHWHECNHAMTEGFLLFSTCGYFAIFWYKTFHVQH